MSLHASKSRTPAAGALLLAIAASCGAAERTTDVGKLHNLALRDLVDSSILVPGRPVTREKFAEALNASAAFVRLHLDEGAFARRFGVPVSFVHGVASDVADKTGSAMIELLDRSGAFVPADQDPRHDVLRPPRESFYDALRLEAADVGASSELADVFERLADDASDARNQGDVISDARHELGGRRWTGSDAVLADIGMSILHRSFDFWSGRDGGVELTTLSDVSDAAHADTVGGIVGGLFGAIAGGVAGAVIGGVPTAGVGAIPGAIVGATVGGAVGGAIGGAGASLAQYIAGDDEPAPAAPPAGG